MHEDLIRQVTRMEQRLDALLKPEILVTGAAIIQDQKTSGTDGGTFTNGAWRTRDINTIVLNTIGSGLSLAANQLTLPAGTYIIQATAMAFYVDDHVTRLQNITDGTTTLTGTSERSSTANTGGLPTTSSIIGSFAIAASKIFELQHRCQTTKATDGFGVTAGSFTVDYQLYATVALWRIA